MARSKWISFGAQQSLERPNKDATSTTPPLPPPSPADAKKFGLENFANTCYANSVLQTLYFCSPFRDLLLKDVESCLPSKDMIMVASNPSRPDRLSPERKISPHAPTAEQSASTSQNAGVPMPSSSPTLRSALQSLFLHIATSPTDKGTVTPRAFIDKLKELNELFRSTMHQDAHEFLNYLLNQIVEEIEEERKHSSDPETINSPVPTLESRDSTAAINSSRISSNSCPDVTFVRLLFEGILTSETRCLTCETVSSRDECFLDLSIDIEQNSSVTACLRQFSASEMLCQKNKFFCDSCCDLQEAEKRMKIKKLPNILALHLKRFKYQEDLGRYTKLAYRVAFPMELRLFNTVDELDDADRLYNLFAIVVHIGNGPHHGHYISIVKSNRAWFLFDDDTVSPLPESDIPRYFGDSMSGSAYILYYQAVDIDLPSLGLRSSEPPVLPERHTVSSSGKPLVQLDEGLSVPPGLDVTSIGGNTLLVPLQSTIQQERLNNSTSNGVIPASPSDLLPHQVSPDPPPVTHTSFGRQIFNTLRRAPSMSATRANANSADGNDSRKSLSEKSPPSSVSPSSSAAIPESSHEIPPPVPPLPPSILASSVYAQSNEARREEKLKEREKTIPGAHWFSKKRKSVKLDKGTKHEGVSPHIPPSYFTLEEDLCHRHSTGRADGTQNTSNTANSRWLQPEVELDSLRKNLDLRHGYDDSYSQPSGSSSPSTTSFFVNGYGCSASPSTTFHQNITASSERSRAGADNDKSIDLKIPQGGPLTTQSNLDHPLPPLPSPMHHLHKYPFSVRSNTEHQALPTFKSQASESDTWLIDRQSVNSLPVPPYVSRSTTLPPHPPLNVGSTASSDDSPVMARRKLSLTTPILGFGRKDRERNKR